MNKLSFRITCILAFFSWTVLAWVNTTDSHYDAYCPDGYEHLNKIHCVSVCEDGYYAAGLFCYQNCPSDMFSTGVGCMRNAD